MSGSSDIKNMRWYDRIFPTVQQTLPYLKEAAVEISKAKGVKEVLTWGKFPEIAKNLKQKSEMSIFWFDALLIQKTF